MFGTVEDYGEMFQDSIVQTRGASLSSTNPIGNPVVYKLVRVARDGRLVPATDEEILEVRDLLENNENDMPFVPPEPGKPEEYIPDEGSPSRFLQLESLEGLFQSETAEAYTEKLNSRLVSKEELMYESQMLLSLPETKFQSSSELFGNEEPIRLSSNECSMYQSVDVSPVTGSPKESAPLSTAASKPEFCGVRDEMSLDNLSIKSLQETFRATFGRDTTCKDKQWLKRRITMGLINSSVVPTPTLTIKDNKPVGEGQDKYNDTIDSLRTESDIIDEERATNCKDTPSSPDETFADHYSGNEDFEGEHRSAKRVRKPTRRYIEEISKTGEKQPSDESMPSKDDRSVSAGGRVVVTRMVSLAGSRIQVPYVSHVRRSRPRENIMALGEFHSSSWEVKATPEESNLNLSSSLLNNDVNRVSGVKSAIGPVQKESEKEHSKPNFGEVDEDMMEAEQLESSGDSSDDNNENTNGVDIPMTQSVIRRKHHRAWTLSEVIKLVEGVSKYGVGKWSEIKRLSFSSYSYRTSVDLKDKWRNLLKASFSQNPSNRMGSLKKQGSMAIPSEIMLQVRELAQKQSKATRMVKESRNGFL